MKNKCIVGCAAVWIWLLSVLPVAAAGNAAVVQASIPQGSDILTVFVAGMENAVQQPCTVGNRALTPMDGGSVTDEGCQVYTTVLFDTSTSISVELRQAALDTLEEIIAGKSPNDAFQLVTFGEQVTVLQAYTTDRYDLVEAADGIRFEAQRSNLYDAVEQSLSHQEVQEELPTLYRTIVISDGLDDTADGITAEELLLELRDAYHPVDVVAVSDAQGENKALAAIARVSGGRYSSLTLESDPVAAAQALSLEGYSYLRLEIPPQLLDGAVRQISVGGVQAEVPFPAVEQPATPSPAPEPAPETGEAASSSQPYGLWLGLGAGALVLLLLALVFLHLRGRREAEPAAEPAQAPQAPSPAAAEDEATVHVEDEICYTIQLRDAKDPERVWKLPVLGTLVIGRAEYCDIRLTDRSVSREQCRIAVQNGAVMLIPLGSTNRTVCNGRPITAPWPLQSGDLLKFGHEALQVEAIQSVGTAGTAMAWGQTDAEKTETIFRENTK